MQAVNLAFPHGGFFTGLFVKFYALIFVAFLAIILYHYIALKMSERQA